MQIKDLGFKLTAKQMLAHKSKEMFILFGGAMGGGKSYWLCMELIFRCFKYPGSRSLLGRAYLSDLKRSTLETMLEVIESSPIVDREVKKHNKTDGFILFRNKSKLLYTGLAEDRRSLDKLKSLELVSFAIDEASELPNDKPFQVLTTRLRQTFPRRRMLYKAFLASNPSQGWLKTRFITKSLENHIFIPARIKDNPYLDSDYEEQQRQTLSEHLVRSWIDGDWDSYYSENQLFILEDIEDAYRIEKESGNVSVGVDIGGNRSESVIAVKRGNSITIEYSKKEKDTRKVLRRVKRLVGSSDVPIFVDSAGYGASFSDLLLEHNLNVIEINGSKRADDPRQFANKKTENYFLLKERLEDEEVRLPRDEKLKSQMLAVKFYTLNDDRFKVESKKEFIKLGMGSPDRLDAVVLANLQEPELEPKKLSQAQEDLAYWQQQENEERERMIAAGFLTPSYEERCQRAREAMAKEKEN